MGRDNRLVIDWGSRAGMGIGEQRGKYWDNCNSTTIKYLIKKKEKCLSLQGCVGATLMEEIGKERKLGREG